MQDVLEIRAVTQPKDGKPHRPKAVCVVELLAPEVLPELERVLGHVALARRRRDKDDQRCTQDISLVVWDDGIRLRSAEHTW